jgi:hypothetical protein
MWERNIVDVKHQPDMPGEVYVYDDHFKNVLELLYCGLSGYHWTIVHDNKRFGFKDQDAWQTAVDELTKLRSALTFEAE